MISSNERKRHADPKTLSARLGTLGLAAAALAVLAVSAPQPAFAYHCDMLFEKVVKTDKAYDDAVQLYEDVIEKVKSGEFGAGELRGARQNLAAQTKRANAAVDEYLDHGCDKKAKADDGDDKSKKTKKN